MINTTKSPMDMNTRAESKISILTDALKKIFKSSGVNLAWIKSIVAFIIAFSKIQTVGFEKLAAAFKGKATTVSSFQRFIAGFALDAGLVARLIFSLLPNEPPYRLALARIIHHFLMNNDDSVTVRHAVHRLTLRAENFKEFSGLTQSNIN